MIKFIKVTLDEITENLDKKRIPLSASVRSKLEKKFRYYGAQSVVDYVDNYIFDGEYLLVAEDGENLKSQNSNVCNYVTGKFWVNNHAHILQSKNGHNLKYIYYLLNQKDFRPYVTGSAQPKLTKENLSRIELSIHDQRTQNKIAKILSTLDAKIELNKRINTELEVMAKTIYDYWFVQFDFPFDFAQGKPGQNGKPYKASGGKMVWNEKLKREIPEGWEVKKLSELASTGSGGTPLSTKKTYYENGTIPWINSGEVNEPFIVKPEKFITHEGLANSSAKLFEKGSILMAMYGATAGKVSLIDFEASTNQAICAINPFDEHSIVYMKFGLEDLYKYLVNLSSGSARDNLSQDKIKDLNLIYPGKKITKVFHNLVQPFMSKILISMKENQKLAELRDWLLPMLMNGQVKVKEATEYIPSESKLSMAAEPEVGYEE